MKKIVMKKIVWRLIGTALLVVFLSQFSTEPADSFVPVFIGVISLFVALGCFLIGGGGQE